jgi:hypothetical protein
MTRIKKMAVCRMVLPLWALLLSGCVNQLVLDDPYKVIGVSDEQLAEAQKTSKPYVINYKGYFQTVEPVEFDTKQFGMVILERNFVSDGSSRPFDEDSGSNMAALLHDALYRGAAQLNFVDGYPGPWTKAQADHAYCLQLQNFGSKKSVAEVNCRAIRYLQVSSIAWQHHRNHRETYWKNMEPRQNLPTLRSSYGHPQ